MHRYPHYTAICTRCFTDSYKIMTKGGFVERLSLDYPNDRLSGNDSPSMPATVVLPTCLGPDRKII